MPARQLNAAQCQAALIQVLSAVREGWGVIAQIWRGRRRSADPPPLFESRTGTLARCDESPGPHPVRADARRAMLYRRLQRRFPLRIAAPR